MDNQNNNYNNMNENNYNGINQYNSGMNNNMGYAEANPTVNIMKDTMPQMDQNSIMNSNNNDMQMMNDIDEYKMKLRNEKEVQNLTSEVDINNTNSIINFGQKASENISRISDELLNNMKQVKSEEASEMLMALTKIMDKFDIDELKNVKEESGLSKLFKRAGNAVAKLFQKYDTLGYEVDKVYVLLKKYESDIREANAKLKKLYDGNIQFYKILEKYIVAGELAVEEIDGYLESFPSRTDIDENEKQMMLQKLQMSKEMMQQRIYDLRIAENVTIQAAPMLQTIQMSNFNLMRKINSSFIVTLPIFKQCLAQAIILKRQEIQAKSIKQLDDKTNELIMRNANSTARQSVEIAKMASGSSIALETLERSYDTIMKGIEDTKQIQIANAQQRVENTKRLETLKYEMKKNAFGV